MSTGDTFGFDVNKIAVLIPVSSGLLDDLRGGMSDEERARLQAWVARRAAARQNMLDRLRAIRDDVTVAIVALHKPTRAVSDYPECDGCEYGGYDGDRPEWPCRTILTLAKVHNIPTKEAL